MVEAERLDTTFRLNVKGRTTNPVLKILGTITSEAGTARTDVFCWTHYMSALYDLFLKSGNISV